MPCPAENARKSITTGRKTCGLIRLQPITPKRKKNSLRSPRISFANIPTWARWSWSVLAFSRLHALCSAKLRFQFSAGERCSIMLIRSSCTAITTGMSSRAQHSTKDFHNGFCRLRLAIDALWLCFANSTENIECAETDRRCNRNAGLRSG